MTYKEAQKWVEDNRNLIGTVTEKGIVYRELVIVPSDEEDRNTFLRNYVLSFYDQTAIIPFIGNDLQVWGIDTEMIRKNGILFYDCLAY